MEEVVSGGFNLKIADFGLSRILDDTEASSDDAAIYQAKRDFAIPLAWTAPEAIRGKCSTASDVWSFGVFMVEVFTIPYPTGCVHDTLFHDKVAELRASQHPHGLDGDLVWDAFNDGYRAPRPEACPEELWAKVRASCSAGSPPIH